MKSNRFFSSVLLIALASCGQGVLAEDLTITSKPAEDEFGRLFTAQYERNAIDRARLTGGFVPAKITGVDENTKPGSSDNQSAQPVKVLGVLLRADGKNKVWLSGGTETQKNILNDRSIIGNINQSANLKVGVNNGTILKPGQVWSAAIGRQEAYQIPVPKLVVAAVPSIQKQSNAAIASKTPESSASSSEVSSSVQSSTK